MMKCNVLMDGQDHSLISKINLNFIYSTGLGYIVEDLTDNDIGLFYGKCQKF